MSIAKSTMNQLQVNQQAFVKFDNLTKYIIDTRQLNVNQCYMVVSFSGNKFFLTKNELGTYLVSLAPTFVYVNLSDLVLNLIENDIIVDATMTNVTNTMQFN